MKRILIAEDEEVLRMLIADSLEDEGYEIEEAVDGVDALEKIKARSYDLVLIDYMMPGMTGLEVVLRTREMQGENSLTFMMLTAKTQKADQDRAREAGVDYFMSKPFSPMELVALVGEVLNGK